MLKRGKLPPPYSVYRQRVCRREWIKGSAHYWLICILCSTRSSHVYKLFNISCTFSRENWRLKSDLRNVNKILLAEITRNIRRYRGRYLVLFLFFSLFQFVETVQYHGARIKVAICDAIPRQKCSLSTLPAYERRHSEYYHPGTIVSICTSSVFNRNPEPTPESNFQLIDRKIWRHFRTAYQMLCIVADAPLLPSPKIVRRNDFENVSPLICGPGAIVHTRAHHD